MTLYIDVSEVVGVRANTGVQRVVREVVRRGMAQRAEGDEAIVPVIATKTRLHRLEPDAMSLIEAPTAGPSVSPRSGWIKKMLRRHSRPLFGVLQRVSFARRMRAHTLHEALRTVTPGSGDTLVLVDTFWNGSSVLDVADHAKKAGARIILVIYDLFPIRQPDQVDPQTAHAFASQLGRAVALADGVLTISRQVTADVIDYFGAALPPEHVRHFYLGQDFNHRSPALDPDLPAAFLTSRAYRYLMIGTIEPRRGHAYVLDAFDRLWAKGGAQQLLIVGKVGWQMDAFTERCAAHPRLGTHLFLIHDAPDATLAAALEASDAVILASYFEGFGLPLVEALLADKPVLASDLAIFREIAGDTPLFFHAGEAAALEDAVRLFEADPAPWRKRSTAFRWLDWNGSARMFFEELAILDGVPSGQDR